MNCHIILFSTVQKHKTQSLKNLKLPVLKKFKIIHHTFLGKMSSIVNLKTFFESVIATEIFVALQYMNDLPMKTQNLDQFSHHYESIRISNQIMI